jgi:hypothetical protein
LNFLNLHSTALMIGWLNRRQAREARARRVVAKVREHLKARNLPERKRRKPWSKKKLCVEVPTSRGRPF